MKLLLLQFSPEYSYFLSFMSKNSVCISYLSL